MATCSCPMPRMRTQGSHSANGAPFYSPSKNPDPAVRKYEHNGNWLQIIPSVKGLATMDDKDILIYCISQLMEKMKARRQRTL